MSATSAKIGHPSGVHQDAGATTKPKKLPKSLVEFWNRPEEPSSNNALPPDSSNSSVTSARSATRTSKYRMLAKKHQTNAVASAAKELDTSHTKEVQHVADTSLTSCASQATTSCEEKSHRSPLVQQRLFDSGTTVASISISSNEDPIMKPDCVKPSDSSQHDTTCSMEESLSRKSIEYDDVKEEDDPFAISNHSTNSFQNVTSEGGPKETSFDSSKQHASWVWDEETHELQHLDSINGSGYSSARGPEDDTNSQAAEEPSCELERSLVRQSSQTSVDCEFPENVMANVVSAATAAILNDSAHLSDASHCSSLPSAMFYPIQEETLTHEVVPNDDDEAELAEDVVELEVDVVEPEEDEVDSPNGQHPKEPVLLQAPADLNTSEYSARIMANIVNAANAAVQENTEGKPVKKKSLKAHFGDTPVRSNRQEEASEPGKRSTPQKPPRDSPPSRRTMNASPPPPGSPVTLRRTFSEGDSKPSPGRDDLHSSFQDDSTSASSMYREDIAADNFDRLFGALFDFMNPPDDHSEMSGETMSTASRRWQRSFDQASQHEASQSRNKQYSKESKATFLNIQSWWPKEALPLKPPSGPPQPPTTRASNASPERIIPIPWLETIQSSLFSKPPSSEHNQVNGWEPKSYFDAASFDAIEELAIALQQQKDSAPPNSATSTQDALSEEFLSRFERLRAEKQKFDASRLQQNIDDGIEVTIGEPKLNDVKVEEHVNIVQAPEKRQGAPGLSPSLSMKERLPNKELWRPTEASSVDAQFNRSFQGSSNIETPQVMRSKSEPDQLLDSMLTAVNQSSRGLITPENSMLMQNDDNSLSPIPKTAESPIADRTDLLSIEDNQIDADTSPKQGGLAQTSSEQASIEQQLKDLYAVVKHSRKVEGNDSATLNESNDFFRTPAKKDRAHINTYQMTPPTENETDVSPAHETMPRQILVRARCTKPRRKLPKISVTTLSGNRPKTQDQVGCEHESGPNVFFHCSLPQPALPKDLNFVSDPMWSVRSAATASRNRPDATASCNRESKLNTSLESEGGLTHLGHEVDFSVMADSAITIADPPSPWRQQLLRNKNSLYSVMNDEKPSPIGKVQRTTRDLLEPSKIVGLDVSAGDDPSQSETSRGSVSASLGKGVLSDDSTQKRGRGGRPRFAKQLSLSWLKRPTKSKLKKGSVLDEDTDFNDTTNDSSFQSMERYREKALVMSPFDIPNVEEVTPYSGYPGSLESNNESFHGYSGDATDTSFQRRPPVKPIARKKQAQPTWQPHLQGLNDTWEEDFSAEHIAPRKQVRKIRPRVFPHQSSLKSMSWRSKASPMEVSPYSEFKGNSSSRRSLLYRSSSLPNMGEDGNQNQQQQQLPPPEQRVNAESFTAEEESFLIPPAASWEEFNGFTLDFWRPQEI